MKKRWSERVRSRSLHGLRRSRNGRVRGMGTLNLGPVVLDLPPGWCDWGHSKLTYTKVLPLVFLCFHFLSWWNSGDFCIAAGEWIELSHVFLQPGGSEKSSFNQGVWPGSWRMTTGYLEGSGKSATDRGNTYMPKPRGTLLKQEEGGRVWWRGDQEGLAHRRDGVWRQRKRYACEKWNMRSQVEKWRCGWHSRSTNCGVVPWEAF